MDQEEESLMSEDKSFLDIAEELDDGDALKEDLLSVEKKDKKIKHLGMKKSLIVMCVAIILIVALIAGYAVFGNKNEGDVNENGATVEVLYDYEQTQITKIDINNFVAGDHIILTSFMNGTVQQWNIDGQLFGDVNQTKVKYIAQFASHLESKYVVGSDDSKLGEGELNEAKLAEYGLIEPSAEVEITYADGNVIKLKVGNSYGNSEGAYILMEGKNKVYIVTDYARSYFTYKLSDLLVLPSLARTAAAAQTIAIFDSARNQTTLSYIPDPLYGTEAWYLVTPTDSETNSEAVDTLFSNLGALALNSYYCDEAGEDMTKYGFDKPEYELQSYDSNGELLDHFIVGKKAEDQESYYCMLIGKDDNFSTSPVYLIKENELKKVYANPVTLANPYLLALNINWLRSGKIVIGEEVYNITIDRQLKYDDEGKVIYNDDGSENTVNTYFINGKQLDETQFKYFYRSFLFLQVEGVVPVDTERKESVWEYELEVVIPVLDSTTGKYEMRELTYTGAYYLINDTFAVFESNQSENAVFTVRVTSINQVKEALGLLLEGKMPTQ